MLRYVSKAAEGSVGTPIALLSCVSSGSRKVQNAQSIRADMGKGRGLGVPWPELGGVQVLTWVYTRLRTSEHLFSV